MIIYFKVTDHMNKTEYKLNDRKINDKIKKLNIVNIFTYNIKDKSKNKYRYDNFVLEQQTVQACRMGTQRK